MNSWRALYFFFFSFFEKLAAALLYHLREKKQVQNLTSMILHKNITLELLGKTN